MKTIFSLLPALALCALLCTCKKDRQELPAITSKGANTFGCLLNGKPIIFTNSKQISGGFIGDYDSLGQRLPIDSFDVWLVFDNGKHTVNLFLNNPLIKNEWTLDKNTLPHPIQNSPNDYVMIDGFISSVNTMGVFKSNPFSTTKPIFSGIFEFECVNPRTCQTMKVTDGRLDVDVTQLQ